MKIVIVGAGAIGTLLGSLLGKGGHEIILIDTKREVVDALNRQGIGLMTLGMENPDDITYSTVQAVKDAKGIDSCDAVLITVKSYDTVYAIRSVAHLVTDHSPVVSLQTGLGNIEVMAGIVPRTRILGGITFMAATALGPGRVRHGGPGKTYIGELDGTRTPRLERLHDAFASAGLEISMVHRIIGRLWCKVIVYSAINTMSSIQRVKNGSLLDQMESITLMKRLIDEGRAVADACGIDLVYPDLYDLLFDACRRTANNLSSMLQDLVYERRTEIDAICGVLCRYGAVKGVPTTTHRTMTELIKLLEKRGFGSDGL